MKVVRNDQTAVIQLGSLAAGDVFEIPTAVKPHQVYVMLQQKPGQDSFYCLIPKEAVVVTNSGGVNVRPLRAELHVLD